VMTGIVGTGTAWLVTAFKFPGRDAFLWLLPLPLAIPTYISAYIYVDMFDALGAFQRMARAWIGDSAVNLFLDLRSLPGAIFVMGLVLYPYVYLAARAAFQMQGAGAIEAARALGASRWRALRDIALPLARPAIAAGLALALLETLNDIGATEYLGIPTLTLSVFSTWLNRNSVSGAAQIACCMLVVVAALIAVERAARRRRSFTGVDHQMPPERAALAGTQAWAATVACALPVALGFALPLLYLLHQATARGLMSGFDPDIAGYAAATLVLAGCATVLTIGLGFGAALAARFVGRRFGSAAIAAASLGYALPGTILALGLLTPLVAIDGLLIALTEAATGRHIGLMLTGSGAGLVIAYAVRFSAIAIGIGQAALLRIPRELDDAARVSGACGRDVLRTIHLPLARPALLAAALLVFVDCLKELPATLMLRPLNSETLSTYIYQFATRGSFEEGALAALLIVAVGILPVVRMMRLADRGFHGPVPAIPERRRD